ncbi:MULTISPECIES: hypothetical protein [unclassified Lysinibacillus]
MPYEAYLNPAQNIHPYTYENILENDVAYLHEEKYDGTLDQFDDNDF